MKASKMYLYGQLTPPPMGKKLHLGCGYKHCVGMINIDNNPDCHPDQVADLEKEAWPYDTETVDYACCVSTLEHIHNVLFFMGEAWRVLKVGGRFEIIVPYWLNAAAIEDPTHIRYFSTRSMGYYAASIYQINTSWYSKDRFNFKQNGGANLLGDKVSERIIDAMTHIKNADSRTPAEEALLWMLDSGNMPGIHRYVHFQLEKLPLPEDQPREVEQIEF